MREFDKISIQEMSKADMLLIIEALEYTGKHTNIEDYISLKDSIVEELRELAEIEDTDFVTYLKR